MWLQLDSERPAPVIIKAKQKVIKSVMVIFHSMQEHNQLLPYEKEDAK